MQAVLLGLISVNFSKTFPSFSSQCFSLISTFSILVTDLPFHIFKSFLYLLTVESEQTFALCSCVFCDYLFLYLKLSSFIRNIIIVVEFGSVGSDKQSESPEKLEDICYN